MTGFLTQIQELLDYPFFVNALTGVVIISVAAAMIGTYIITRRLVAISGGITHACFGGLGLGYYLGVSPIAVAAVFAVGSALGVEWMSSRQRVREDSAIAVVWSLGMAIGVLFVFLTPGFVPELNSFLFGNILNISTVDLWVFGVYTVVLAALFMWRYKEIVAVAFDRDFARVMRLPVTFLTFTMTVMVALCIVLTIRLVGIMLLMAVISLPQMTAELFSRRFGRMMVLSTVISLVCSLCGLLMSVVIDVPCSALIVMVMASCFFLCRIYKSLEARWKKTTLE